LLTIFATWHDYPGTPDALVIKGGTIIEGTGAEPILNGVVVIQGNRILAVGQNFSIPSEAQVINADGGTIIPGMINAHVHHTTPAEKRYLFLKEGVTSVCDLGSSLSEIPKFEQDRINLGLVARGFKTGPIITASGGYPDGLYGTAINYEVTTPQVGQASVLDLDKRGVDIIKIALDPGWDTQKPLPLLDLVTIQAIVQEAHAKDLLVRVHLIQSPQLDLAI